MSTNNKKDLPAHIAMIMDGNGRWQVREVLKEQQDMKRVQKL